MQTVVMSSEFRRIQQLPRVEHEVDLTEAAVELTQQLKTDDGTMELRETQAATLLTIAQRGGCLASLPVGAGKTLVTFLAGAYIGAERPLLLIPANLRRKTEKDFRELAEHWKGSGPLIKSYSYLAQEKNKRFLPDYAPDLIIADEAEIHNPSSGYARRLWRYLDLWPKTTFVALSGTLFSRSVTDMHGMCYYTLRDRMPLPKTLPECRTWASAVDEKVLGERAREGALLHLDSRPALDTPRETARDKLGSRIFETPGVVSIDGPLVDVPIHIVTHQIPMPLEMEGLVTALLDKGESPRGDVCTALDVYRTLRCFAAGCYYQWDPKPPEPWLEARRNWSRFVRQVIDEDSGCDTEAQVKAAARDGTVSTTSWAKWQAVAGSYTGNVFAYWFSDFTLDYVQQVVGQTPTIVWVEQVEVGQYLAERTGWPYYRQHGLDERGRMIDQSDPADGPIIASIASNKKGRNLQHWSRFLVVTPPQLGSAWEQLIGRAHRPGQKETVHIDVLVQHPRIALQWRQAIRDAKMFHGLTKQPRKLLLAQHTERKHDVT